MCKRILTFKTLIDRNKMAENLQKQLEGVAEIEFERDQLKIRLNNEILNQNNTKIVWHHILSQLQLQSGIENLNYDPQVWKT